MDDRVLCVFVTLDSTSFVFDHDKIRLRLDSTLIFSYRNIHVTSLKALVLWYQSPSILISQYLKIVTYMQKPKVSRQKIKSKRLRTSLLKTSQLWLDLSWSFLNEILAKTTWQNALWWLDSRNCRFWYSFEIFYKVQCIISLIV